MSEKVKWFSKEDMQLSIDLMIEKGFHDDSDYGRRFRCWTIDILKEFIIKGYVIDDKKLKGEDQFEDEYFNDLLERLYEIRISERNNFQKIADVYEEFSCGYDLKSETTQSFFQMVIDMMQLNIEVRNLNLITNAFLDTAERRVHNHMLTRMAEWKRLLEKQLGLFDEGKEGEA